MFRKYYEQLISEREEGVIIKPVDSIYQPGFVPPESNSHELSKKGWIKFKKDYIDGYLNNSRYLLDLTRLGDTADFAIIGGILSTRTSTKFTPGGINKLLSNVLI